MVRTLTDLQAGDSAIVLCNSCESSGSCRLAEMGLAEGEEIRVLQDGCPMLLQVGDARMCMRTEAAALITVVDCA